jgi:hypothetical protein
VHRHAQLQVNVWVASNSLGQAQAIQVKLENVGGLEQQLQAGFEEQVGDVA